VAFRGTSRYARGTPPPLRTALLASLVAFAALGCRASTYTALGDVVAVDEASGRVTISHDDIPGLMPAMTMEFPVGSRALLAGVAAGHRVRFVLERGGDRLTLVSLQIVGQGSEGHPGLHDHTPHHGGVVAMAGMIHLEVLAVPEGRVRVWVTDVWRRPVSLADITGTVTLELARGRQTFPLVVANDALEARTPPLEGDDVRAQVEVARAGSPVDLTFVLPVGSAAAGAAHVPAAGCAPPAERPGAAGRRPRCAIAFPRAVSALAGAPDGSLAMVAVDDAGVTVWRLPEGRLATGLAPPPPVRAPDDEPPHGVSASAMAVSRDATQAAVSLEHKLLLYDLASGRLRAELPAPSGVGRSLAWSADGTRLLVSIFSDPPAHLLLVGERREERQLRVDGDAAGVAFAAEGLRAAVGSEFGAITLFDAASGTPIRALPAGHRPADALDFAGDRLVSASADGKLRVWDTGSGQLVVEYDAGTPLRRLTVAPSGKLAATAGQDDKIRVHNLDTGAVRETLAWHRGGVVGLAWARGVLVSGDAEGWVALWDVDDGA
jgi:Cu/Ag efflux protein CusF